MIEQFQVYTLAGSEFLIRKDLGDSWSIEIPSKDSTSTIDKEALSNAVVQGSAVLQKNPPLELGDKVLWVGRKYGSCSDDHLFTPGAQYSVAGFHHGNNEDIDIEQYIDGKHIIIRTAPTEIEVHGI